MSCDLIEELLSPYLEDELDSEKRQTVSEHLKSCQDCSSLLAFMKETQASLVDFPELDVSQDLQEKLYSIALRKKRWNWVSDILLKPSLQPVFAAATVLLMIASFYFFHPNKSALDKSINKQIHLGYSKLGQIYAKAENIAQSLDGYKDDFLVSLKNLNPLGRNEDQ